MRHRLSKTLLLCAALSGAGQLAAAEVDRADLLKAGYLVNFVKFVDWPAETPADTLTLCFIGAPGVRRALADDLDNKHAGARRLAVRELNNRDAAIGCDVLYVDSTAGTPENLASRGMTLPASGLLTVGDSADFLEHGGVIGLFTDNNRLKFNVNLKNARHEGLKVSSALLQLATTVQMDNS